LKVQPLITRRASPAEAPSVYASLARKDDKSVGVLFDWTQPGPWRARVDTVSPLRLAAAGLRRVLQRAPARGPATLATRKDGRKLRFGLIGCGEIAADSATAIRAAPNATITHAVDTSPERARSLAAATGAKATTELRELLDSPNVDAVLISTPHNLHAPLAIQAAQHGKHVVVEKPMAITVADCDRMIAAAASHRVLLSVCYCSRFEPAVSEARRLIEAGAVGRVFGTRISFGQWRGREYWTEGLTGRTRGDWRRHRETAGGGVLIMNACHLLDYMTWLVGSPISDVSATLATLASDVEVEDTVSLSYRYQSGAVGSLDATTALVGPWVFSQEIWGRDGRLQLAPQLRFWSSRVIDGRDRQTWHTVRLSPSDSRARYFEAFANAVLDDGAPPVTGAEARAVQAAIEAAYSSVETRRTVAVVG
jgi:predicted dehydrogenase